MARYDLRSFIAELEARGELVRVKTEVDPVLEITEIYDRVVKKGGPALIFERVKGSSMPLLINGYGTDARMTLALGREPAQIGKDLMALVKTRPPRGLGEAITLARKARAVLSFPPKRVRFAKCQQVVHTGDAVDLAAIPVLKCWPLDAGRFVTLPQVYTRDPESGERNMGMYRMQIVDRNTTGMHWQTHKHATEHYRKAKRLGVKLPVAVALGGDPALAYGATAPLPPGFDEVMLCGYIRRQRMRMVACKTQPLEVPADAEIVLEGYVDPAEEPMVEGPFGDHTGYYSLADLFPKFHVTAITHRKDAIYPTTVVGIPPQEDGPMGKATERLFLELMRFQVPELVEMNMPVEGAFHNLMIVSIQKRYPGHARKAMLSLWGAGLVALEKSLVVVDEHVNVHDTGAILHAILDRLDPARDLLLIDQVPTDTLDHAAPKPDLGSHVGIDATTPMGPEPPRRIPPAAGPLPPLEGVLDSHRPHARLLLVTIQKTRAHQARETMQKLWKSGVPESVVIVVFENMVDVRNASMTLFHACANLDPARDIIRDGWKLGIDATLKRTDEDARAWPPLIVMDADTKSLVDKRWPEYGIP